MQTCWTDCPCTTTSSPFRAPHAGLSLFTEAGDGVLPISGRWAPRPASRWPHERYLGESIGTAPGVDFPVTPTVPDPKLWPMCRWRCQHHASSQGLSGCAWGNFLHQTRQSVSHQPTGGRPCDADASLFNPRGESIPCRAWLPGFHHGAIHVPRSLFRPSGLDLRRQVLAGGDSAQRCRRYIGTRDSEGRFPVSRASTSAAKRLPSVLSNEAAGHN